MNWASLEGTVLGGSYLLERFASADQNTASFYTRTGGERSSRALARLVAADDERAEQQIQVWQAIKRSGHPHLLPIWGAGRMQADGHDLIYVVVEAADENLAGVLGERVLEPGETGEILVSLVGALGHLHSHGLVHGSLSPEQVLAVGETVKLSSGGVRRIGWTEGLDIHKAKYRAPESEGENVAPAADIWCLGATLVEALTQRTGADPFEEAADLPAPFNAIAKSCLQRDPGARGSLSHILALYEGKTEGTVAAAPRQMAAAAGAGVGGGAVPLARVDAGSANRAVEHEPLSPVYLAPGPIIPEADAFSAAAFSAAEEAPVEEVRSFDRPQSTPITPEPIASSPDLPREWQQTNAIRPEPVPPEANAPAREEIVRAKRRAWILVAVALAILLAVIWVLRPSRSSSNRTQGQGRLSSSTAKVKQGQTMTLPAAGQNGAPAAISKAPAEVGKRSMFPASAAGRGPIWRVVLYTYHRAADAEKRAAAINSRHPGFGAEVFTPNGEGKAPYLVSVGGSVNRDDAVRLRREALRWGLPRDSYLQNYSR